MKRKSKVLIGFFLVTLSCTTRALAVNLLDIYHQAFTNDPTYKAAKAKWLADRENVPISRSLLFPHIEASGNIARIKNNTQGLTASSSPPGLQGYDSSFNNHTAAYALTLTQPIINFANLASVWSAQATVKQSEAALAAAYEDLIFRAAQAYFNVLQAQDVLRFTQSQKTAVGNQLAQTKHKFEVGLIAITDVQTAQASYDANVAAEISAANQVADTLEKLGEITGSIPINFDILKDNLPLLMPNPATMEKWVSAAEQQNFDLLAARFGAEAARQTIKVKDAGHLPTLTLGGNYNYNYNNNVSGLNNFTKNKTSAVNLNVNLPIFSGGGVVAQSNQANYLYQQALSQQELSHRNVVSLTRQAYLGVLSGISKIKADKQALISNESALNSTQAAYGAGMRTMVDVLNAESNLYDAKRALAQDQYAYLLQTLTLKKMAGILTVADLQKISTWFGAKTKS
jgi:outer membrane protein